MAFYFCIALEFFFQDFFKLSSQGEEISVPKHGTEDSKTRNEKFLRN